MADYTPTTEEVRYAWVNFGRAVPDAGAFNRWLAGVKAEAYEEGYGDCFNNGTDCSCGQCRTPNPHKAVTP